MEAFRAPQLYSLSGLRFFAALLIFGVHASERFNGPAGAMFLGPPAVSLFFLSSGFILTWSRKPSDTPLVFYRRRAARIVPAYWISLLAAFFVIQYEHSAGGLVAVGSTMVSSLLLQSWIPKIGVYFGGNSVGWTLSDEAFFYLIFPYVIAKLESLSWRSLGCVAVVAIGASIALPIIFSDPRIGGFDFWLIYVCPLTRFADFALGILCALIVMRHPNASLPRGLVISLAGIAWLFASEVSGNLGLTAVTLIPFVLLIISLASADSRSTNATAFDRVLSTLGRWTYSFYLVHQLVIRAVTVSAQGTNPTRLMDVELTLLTLLISILLSVALFLLIEQPFERRLRGPATLRASSPKIEAPAI